MVRVITQETYDEVVQENISEFDMTPEEAVKEAIAQFEAQGVDLSNIIKDLAIGSGENHLVSETVLRLKELCNGDANTNDIIKELDVLKSECNKDLARRIRAGKDGAYKLLIEQLTSKSSVLQQEMCERDTRYVVSLLNTLTALMDTQPDLLDSKGIDIMKTILDNVENEEILIATLKWISNCCIKHEMNRQRIFAKNIPENLKLLLNSTTNEKLLIETLQVIKKLTLDDDIRVEFGKAHEHSRELGIMMIEPINNLLTGDSSPLLTSACLSALGAVCVRAELCGAARHAAVLHALLTHYDKQHVVHHAANLVTVLAGNDDVKRDLMKKGIAPIIVSLLDKHLNNPSTCALLLKCISSLSLREPQHSRELAASGAPRHVVRALSQHAHCAAVQKNGCWAIRNMVARCRELNPIFHELGIESVLHSALEKFESDFGFDIKSALRDLECDVKLQEQWTGKGVQLEQ